MGGRSGVMVSMQDSGLSSLDSNHCQNNELWSWAAPSFLMVPLFTQVYKWVHSQGCALRVPRCLRQLTFAFGRPDKLIFLHISFMLGALDLIV